MLPLFLVVCLPISILVVSVWYPGTEGIIVSHTKNDEAQLIEVTSSVIEHGGAEDAFVSGVRGAVCHSDSKMVELLCGGPGLAPSFPYTRLYHSPPDVPLGLRGEVMLLVETDTGWGCEQVNGGN